VEVRLAVKIVNILLYSSMERNTSHSNAAGDSKERPYLTSVIRASTCSRTNDVHTSHMHFRAFSCPKCVCGGASPQIPLGELSRPSSWWREGFRASIVGLWASVRQCLATPMELHKIRQRRKLKNVRKLYSLKYTNSRKRDMP